MKTLFVTAAGTDMGKTYVAGLLVSQLRRAGRSARALKPVATGFDAGRIGETDSGRLLDAQGIAPTRAGVDRITPWRFAAPLSADMAAARERRPIPFDELVAFCRTGAGGETTIIEGIGGVMAPLDSRHTVLDWIAALGCPAALVVGSYLGALSHALTAAGMLRARSVELAGVVVNESIPATVDVLETAAVIERFVSPVPVRVLLRNAQPDLLPLLEQR